MLLRLREYRLSDREENMLRHRFKAPTKREGPQLDASISAVNSSPTIKGQVEWSYRVMRARVSLSLSLNQYDIVQLNLIRNRLHGRMGGQWFLVGSRL